MIRTLTTTHGDGLLAAMRQQIEESRLQTICNTFGASSVEQLKQIVEEARRRAQTVKSFNVFPSRAEMIREAEKLNSSPFGSIRRELMEHAACLEREDRRRESRETPARLVREYRNKLAREAADYSLSAEVEPIKVNVHLTVVIKTEGEAD